MLSEAAFKLLCFSFAVFDLQMFYSQAHEVDHGQGLHLIKKKQNGTKQTWQTVQV